MAILSTIYTGEAWTAMYLRSNENIRYRLRLMVALVVSLLLVTICFNLPITSNQRPKPWKPQFGQHGMIAELRPPAFMLPPITGTGIIPAGSPAVDPAPAALPAEITTVKEDSHLESADTWRIETQSVPVLEHAEIMPEIPGGIGAYYILIEYPEEAISQGIEGSLSLIFTVNRDGTTSDILVERSLHALLDSAAVQALRRTRFIPGRHQGETARVRMRLPIRFQIIVPGDSTHSG
ncbi:MAG: energy transducer TonB [Rhodothermaceae bacterium]|nr:energy transducer TonB [Rhodothermaceae bacterium]MYF63424.1 energy transducer TonB [Rhodothermaceae bacterium]